MVLVRMILFQFPVNHSPAIRLNYSAFHMTQKNDTVPLILSLLITGGLIGAGFWWFTQRSNIHLGGDRSPAASSDTVTSPTASPANPAAPTAQTQFPIGLFSYGGSTSWAPIRSSVEAALQQSQPGFRLRYTNPINQEPGSGAGIQMLIRSELSFAQSSRPLNNQEIQQAQQRGFSLKEIPIAIDGIAVAVNPSLNIRGVTVDQIRSIYSGKLRNWKELGGPDLPIQPFERAASTGAGTIETVLGDQPVGESVRDVPTTTEALRQLAASPGGIYFASAPEVVSQCTIKPLPVGRSANELVPPYREPLLAGDQCRSQRNQLNLSAIQSGQYPLTRNLYIVVKQNGQADQQAGEAYAAFLLSNQGQALIEKAGFVRIR